MKAVNLRRLKGNIPTPQLLTIAHLRDNIQVPEFQRWIVETNIKALTESISEVGVLRYPVVYYCEDSKKEFIIDGNHIRTILINPKNGYKDEDKVPVVYKVVPTFKDAIQGFKNLNTKGKPLDMVDVTKMYVDVNIDGPSIYKDVWAMMGNPKDADEVRKVKGFTVRTIIEFLIGHGGIKSSQYKNGDITSKHFEKYYSERKMLLNYLLQYANDSWKSRFVARGLRQPTGTAICGFAKYWFNNELHKKSDHWEHLFLNAVNNIYEEYSEGINNNTLLITRESAGPIMDQFFKSRVVKKPVVAGVSEPVASPVQQVQEREMVAA